MSGRIITLFGEEIIPEEQKPAAKARGRKKSVKENADETEAAEPEATATEPVVAPEPVAELIAPPTEPAKPKRPRRNTDDLLDPTIMAEASLFGLFADAPEPGKIAAEIQQSAKQEATTPDLFAAQSIAVPETGTVTEEVVETMVTLDAAVIESAPQIDEIPVIDEAATTEVVETVSVPEITIEITPETEEPVIAAGVAATETIVEAVVEETVIVTEELPVMLEAPAMIDDVEAPAEAIVTNAGMPVHEEAAKVDEIPSGIESFVAIAEEQQAVVEAPVAETATVIAIQEVTIEETQQAATTAQPVQNMPVAEVTTPTEVVVTKKKRTRKVAETVQEESAGETSAKSNNLPMDWEGHKTYYTIGEVAALFQVKTSHIRFWTNEFKLKVRTTRKGDRLYTPELVKEVRAIYHLVKERGFTLAGAKAKLKSQNRKDVETVDLKTSLRQLRSQLVAIKNQL